MKFFQGILNMAGDKLSSSQLGLKAELLPQFRSLKQQGYGAKEAGFALTGYFKRTNTAITTEKCVELLKDPESLILSHRKAENKSNRLTSAQTVVLGSLVKDPAVRARISAFVEENYVTDAIPSITFKGMVQYLAVTPKPSAGQIAQWKQR